ncbi:hydrogenase 4 subunit H [uncultured Gilliamella sp.]|uniref:hydrogenase 4 subunit H n=1 Tax=uncultured Gilliamella sp. TaxID=1193505 RepID=UPI0025D34C66|nr:hydrogenase 4 subunit H [uncultured Gilliamella sp.]
MLKLLKIIHKVGDTTVKYPFKPLEVPLGFRGKPNYDPEQCIACGACTTACPANALTMQTNTKTGKREWQLFVGRCIFCGRCEEVCPTRAIELSQEFELAVMNKADLYEQATFALAKCHVCERFFAPQKEIDYVMALLIHAGLDEQEVLSRQEQFETCPECKRRQNIVNKSDVQLDKYAQSGVQHESEK